MTRSGCFDGGNGVEFLRFVDCDEREPLQCDDWSHQLP